MPLSRILPILLFVLLHLCGEHVATVQAQITVGIDFVEAGGSDPISISPEDGTLRCRSLTVAGPSGIAETILEDPNLQVFEEQLPYECRANFLSGFAAAPFRIDSSDLVGTPPVTFIQKTITYFPIDQQIRIRVRDLNDQPIPNIPFRVEIILDDTSTPSTSTNPIPEFRKAVNIPPGPSASVLTDVIGGQSYRLILRPGSGASSPIELIDLNSASRPNSSRNAFKAPNDGGVYYLPKQFTTISVPSNVQGPIPTFDLFAEPALARIQVSLFDSNGESSADGFASIFALPNSSLKDSFPIKFDGEIPAGNGIVIPVPAGRTYKVIAGNKTTSGSTTEQIKPTPVSIEIPTDSTSTFPIEFRKKTPNYSLLVDVGAIDQNGQATDASLFSFLSCFAHNVRQEHSYSENPVGSAITLPLYVEKLKVAEKWRIGCYGVRSTSGNSRRFFGERLYTTKTNRTADTISLTIEDKGIAYGEVSQAVPVDDSNNIRFPDGESSLDIPSQALGSSGTATVVVRTARGFRTASDVFPLTTWDITPTLGGETVTTPNDEAEICIPVDPNDLEELGASAENIFIARYSEDEQRWITSETTVFTDEDGNITACGTVDHFSIFGTIIDVAAELRDTTPSNLRLSFNKKSACVIKWKAPDVEIASGFTYILRTSKSGTKNKCQQLSSDQMKEFTLVNTTKKTLKTKKGCCAEVLVEDASSTTPRKFRKKK